MLQDKDSRGSALVWVRSIHGEEMTQPAYFSFETDKLADGIARGYPPVKKIYVGKFADNYR